MHHLATPGEGCAFSPLAQLKGQLSGSGSTLPDLRTGGSRWQAGFHASSGTSRSAGATLS